jgi:phosphoribosylformylglycinamidine (FGAM) synthase-like enzyme
LIYLIGESQNDIASSQYLASWHKVLAAPAPYFDIDQEYATHQVIKELIKHKLVSNRHMMLLMAVCISRWQNRPCQTA